MVERADVKSRQCMHHVANIDKRRFPNFSRSDWSTRMLPAARVGTHRTPFHGTQCMHAASARRSVAPGSLRMPVHALPSRKGRQSYPTLKSCLSISCTLFSSNWNCANADISEADDRGAGGGAILVW